MKLGGKIICLLLIVAAVASFKVSTGSGDLIGISDFEFLFESHANQARAKKFVFPQIPGFFPDEKCSKSDISQLLNDMKPCFENAGKIKDHEANKPLTTDAINCNFINNIMNCFDSYSLRCFTPSEVESIKLKVLSDISSKFGAENSVVSSCPIFNNVHKRYARSHFGSDDCSKNRIQSLTKERDVCHQSVIKTNRENIGKLIGQENYYKLLQDESCNAKLALFKCYKTTVFQCTSKDAQKKIIDGHEKEFEDLSNQNPCLKFNNISFANCPAFEY